jgi:HlyD family secretion protein
MPTQKMTRPLIIVAGLIILAAGAAVWWQYFHTPPLVGFASGNGRLEVKEIHVATKFQARVKEVLVDEGDTVQAGQVVVRMDTSSLEAQLRQAQAQVHEARKKLLATQALINQRRSEQLLASRDLDRARALYVQANIAVKDYDRAQTAMRTAEASTAQAEAQLAENDASIKAAIAETERIQSDLNDSTLKAPRNGRVQFRLAEPGEVLPPGGRVLTIIDPIDAYMYVYLHEALAGKVALGAQARLTFDALPGLVVPATVTFVADKAQFTPKDVETRTEREKLMFRVKVQIDAELVKGHEAMVKPGLPGVAYVQLDPVAQWPATLQTKLTPQVSRHE